MTGPDSGYLVGAAGLSDAYVSLVTLREIRRYIVRSHAVMMAVFLGMVYALVSMAQGPMLVLGHLGGGTSSSSSGRTPSASSPGTIRAC